MVTAREIVQELWDAQGYGNVAVYRDGSMVRCAPGESGERGGVMPVFIFKPLLLVAGHPMLDHALGDADLLEEIERTLRERGMDLYQDA